MPTIQDTAGSLRLYVVCSYSLSTTFSLLLNRAHPPTPAAKYGTLANEGDISPTPTKSEPSIAYVEGDSSKGAFTREPEQIQL